MREFRGGVPAPLSIQTTVDAPAGSGLGSSSALVVALVEAFRAQYALPPGRYEIAHLAWDIERNDLGLMGGRQDQYAAAFGGVNFIEFLPNDRVIVNPLRLVPGAIEEIESSIVICFTRQSRNSHDIIVQQKSGVSASNSDAIQAMHELKADANEMKRAFVNGDIRRMANVLHNSWNAKRKSAHGISNTVIDEFHAIATRMARLRARFPVLAAVVS
jgi:D-glycero-alpha-D-manno-heptose-7-phosphate kinase